MANIVLPQGTIECSRETSHLVLLVAGGRRPEPQWLQTLPACPVYAADKGGDYCVDAGLFVQHLYGDQDSADPSKWQQAATCEDVKIFPTAKDATDLDLVLEALPPNALVLATGVWGGRADHLYANMLSLLTWQQKNNGQVIMADEKELMLFLEEETNGSFCPKVSPSAISVLPFSQKPVVTLNGVRWPLTHYKIGTKSYGYTISNEVQGTTVEAYCEKGCLGLYVNF